MTGDQECCGSVCFCVYRNSYNKLGVTDTTHSMAHEKVDDKWAPERKITLEENGANIGTRGVVIKSLNRQ